MTIPASNLVQMNPGVVNAGGNSLALNGLFLTQNTAMPAGTVLSFANPTAVSNFFGPASAEAALAPYYFNGYTGATQKPGAMLFAPFNLDARAACLKSGSLATLTLTALQALAGVLTITINGTVETSSEISLADATSFSNAATLIAAAFTGTVPVVSWNAVNKCFVFLSPTAGPASTITVASGTLAASLNLTSATGAQISQGAAADTPATAMNNALAKSQNWATFVTLWEPVLADKINFAIWSNAQNNQYGYIAWDTDAQAIIEGATEPFGVLAKAAAYNGVMCISGDAAAATAQGTTLAALTLNIAAFVAGYAASLNFAQTNGRATVAYRTQAGLLANVQDATSASNLLANGYSFYGAYATANENFVEFQNGQMPGEFDWLDTFLNEIYLNSQFQLAMMTYYQSIGAINYTPSGYTGLRSALMPNVTAALNFGSIRAGVVLSASEISEVNDAAGVNIATTLQNQGYYLQILDPGAEARQARTSPIINFWYTDGGAVQTISMNSINVL